MIHILFGFKYDNDAYRIYDNKSLLTLDLKNGKRIYDFFPSIIFKIAITNREDRYSKKTKKFN